jgi:hypothetical protein
MLLSKVIEIFLILQDKTGSPNVIEDEVIDLVNMAIEEYLDRVFPDNEGGTVNWEYDTNVTANIQPLIWTLTSLSTTSGGILTTTTVNTALQTATSDVNAAYFRVGSIGYTASGETIPVKYIKQNNRWSFEQNYFKKPSVTKPRWTYIADGFQFYPATTLTPLTLNVVKEPKVLTSANLADEMEFSDYACYNILSIALKLAGVATRDTDMLEVDARLQDLNIIK